MKKYRRQSNDVIDVKVGQKEELQVGGGEGLDLPAETRGRSASGPVSSDNLGYSELGATIPNDPRLVGLQLFGQFFWGSRCQPQGTSASDAADFTIQR